MANAKKLKVKLVRSIITCTERQRECVKGLGLRKLNSEKVLENTPAVKGLVNKVRFLLDVSEA
jgi:large subunit ribosomal protein L30